MAGYAYNSQPTDPNQELWDQISQVGGGPSQAPVIWGNQGGGFGGGAGDSGGMFGGGGGGGGGFDLGSILKGFGGGGWINNFGTIAKGIGDIGGLYMGIKQLGLAKDSFKLQKRAYETNLRNQTASYNTQVGDRINGRSYATQAERDAALKAAQLPTEG